MKIAYLVQCHKNPQQLNLLFGQLLKQDCDIYVHIDKRSLNIDSEITKSSRIFVIPVDDRVCVKWGGISQVDATLKLIKYAIESGNKYDCLWLISGQDLPIKSSKTIINYLSDNQGTAFIEVKPTDTKRYQRLKKRNEVRHTQYLSSKGFLPRVLRNAWYLMTGGRYHTFKLFRRKLGSDTFYFGSSWWCLPSQSVNEMYEYLQKNPKFYKFFKHCHCPDESFFQTLFMNHTSFNDNVQDKLVYVDWTRCKDSPRILVEDDYETITGKNTEYMFARKFDMYVDEKIIQKITQSCDGEIEK